MKKKQKNLHLDEIVGIEDVGIIQTYDFTIPKTHCFFANDILVHNCLEEISDCVIICHWNWFYTREGNKNDYIVKVAKNRGGKTGEYYCLFEPEYYRIKGVDNVPDTAMLPNRKDIG